MSRFMRRNRVSAVVLVTVMASLSAAQSPEGTLLRNGGFEETYVNGGPGAPGQVPGTWKIVPAPGDGAKPLAPADWRFNGGYPGELSVLTEGAASGKHCIRIRGTDKKEAHIFQSCKALQAGRHYKVSFSVRDGKISAWFYEYRQDGSFAGSRAVCSYVAPAGQWRRVTGFYSSPKDKFGYAALALAVPRNGSVLIDNVAIEEIAEIPADKTENDPDLAPVIIENDDARLVISGDGRLRSLISKASGKDYAVPTCTEKVFVARHDGRRLLVTSIRRDGDVLNIGFLDAGVRASIKVTNGVGYFRFEVLDVQPADLRSLEFALSVKRLDVNAVPYVTYDDAFAIGNLSVTPNSIGWQRGAAGTAGKGYTSQIAWYRNTGGIKGGVSAFVAVPFERFLSTMQQLERDTGLPCPMLDGKWLRESEPILHSYLFATAPGSGYKHGDTEDLIRYAKIGGFGAIMLYKSSVFKNMGHYEINTRCYPEGLKSLKEEADKIHAAGLRVGLHLFGPSVSRNDPYIRPVPDDRLHYLACPPLAKGVDAKAEVVTLAEQPEKLPFKVIRIGNEIVTFTGREAGTPCRLTGCLRGAFGTSPAAHDGGATVRGMLQIGQRYLYFLADPDTSILKEMTERFAHIVNTCGIDMVYFDGAGGFAEKCFHFSQRNYLLSKWFLHYYKAFDHDVLFQYSSGSGFGVIWHFVARAASADGHGDLKWYLDQRLDGILRMKKYFTVPDVGWYGLDMHRKPDQLEYVAAKCIGAGGSISVEATAGILNSHPRAREIMEMLGRYEKCRLANYFPDSVKRKLLEKEKEFKLFGNAETGWRLYRAHYHEPHAVALIDGKANVWTVVNPLDRPCRAALAIERQTGQPATPADYDAADAFVLTDFADMNVYRSSDHNRYEQYVQGGGRTVTPEGPAMQGVRPKLVLGPQGRRPGESCVIYSAENTNPNPAGDPGKVSASNGWCGRGKRFPKPLDLSSYKAFGWWMHGDNKNETFFIQLWDAKGRVDTFTVPVGFKGWRFKSFPRSKRGAFDWTRVEYLIFYLIKIPGDNGVSVRIGPVKALRTTSPQQPLNGLTVSVNDARISIPAKLGLRQCITTDGLGNCTFWPGGMQPGREIDITGAPLMLQPGPNRIQFVPADPKAYRGDVSVRISQIWSLEK